MTTTTTTILTLTHSGRVAMAEAMATRSLCLAVGSGDAAWGETPPAIDTDVSALTAPFALLRPLQAAFVGMDAAGEIEWADGSRWSISATPTNTLFLRYRLGFQDAPDQTVREYALVANPQVAAGVPPALKFVPWADVTDPGRYFVGRRLSPRPRLGSELELVELLGL